MFAVGLAALPQGYDEGAKGYWQRRQLEDEQAARTALGNYFSSIPQTPSAPIPGPIASGPPSSFPPVSGAPSAVAPALGGGASAEAAAIRAGTWAPTSDYDAGLALAQPSLESPPGGGSTMGGAPGAPYSAIMPGPSPGVGPTYPRIPGYEPTATSRLPVGAPAQPAQPAQPARVAQVAPAAPTGPGPAGGPVSRGTANQGPPTWEQMARAIAQANPGIKPDVLARAVGQALPLMQADSRLWYQALQAELGAARLKAQYDLVGARTSAITQLMNDFRRNNPGASPEDEASYYRLIQGDPTKMAIAETRAQPKTPASIALQKFLQENPDATAQDIQNFTNQPSFTRQEKAIGARKELQTERLTAAGERQDKSIAAAGARTEAQIVSREKLAELNRDQKLELFNRSYQQREEQFRERAALAQQRINQGKLEAEDLDAMADAIAHYRINPATALSRLNAQTRTAVLRNVQEINPKWSQSDWKASYDGITRFTTGRQGDSARFLSVADNHLKVLEDLTKKLANPSDLRAVRAVVNWAQKQQGGEAVTNFETARHFVASEVTKAVIGGPGGLGDRLAAQAPIDPNASVAQIMGSIGTYRQLITGQLKGLKSQFERIPGVAPDEWDNRFGTDIITEPAPPVKPASGIKFNWVTPPAGVQP